MTYENVKNLIAEFKRDSFSTKEALILMQKFRLYYQMTHDPKMLKIIMDFSNYCYQKNNLDARILLFSSYFNFLIGEDVQAMKSLKIVNNGARYYKASNKDIFYSLNYIKAKFSVNKKVKEKSIKILYDSLEEYKMNGAYLCDIFLTDLDFEKSYDMLVKTYKSGNRSAIFYESLYKYFVKTKNLEDSENLIYPLLKWCIRRKIDYSKIVKKKFSSLSYVASVDINLATKIYKDVQDDDMLFNIVSYYIKEKDVSQKAFEHYFLANKKQILIDDLNKMFIRASYYNGYENISYFYMSTYLRDNNLEDDLKGYVYHILVNNEHLNSLIDIYILDFTNYVKSVIDKEFYKIFDLTTFKYVLLNKDKFDFSEIQIKQIERIVFENLFLYKLEVTGDFAKKALIVEPDMKNLKSYSFTDKTAIIKSSNSEFSYYLYDDNFKSIVHDSVNVTPMLFTHEIDIYLYFYDNGYYSDELFIRLSNYFFEQTYNYKDMIYVLEKTILIERNSSEFNKKINAYLASTYTLLQDYDNALINIDNLDSKELSTPLIEKMLVIYLKTDNLKKVYELINLNYYKISENMILLTLDFLKSEEDFILFSKIFYRAYKDGLNNIKIINVILNYYDFTFNEMLEMISVCNEKNINADKFFEKAIISAMDKKFINKKIEYVFLKICDNLEDNSLLENYIIFLAYKMLKDDYEIDERTINFIEENTSLSEFSYYILFVYYNNNGTKNEEMFLKVLKEIDNKDVILETKNLMSKHYKNYTYFRKYKAFSYKAKKDKSVFLHYKIDNSEYKKIEMQYFHFSVFTAKIVMFYGERVEYYFSEVSSHGSTETQKYIYEEKNDFIQTDIMEDYDLINNAIICKNKYLMNDAEIMIEKLLVNVEPFICEII